MSDNSKNPTEELPGTLSLVAETGPATDNNALSDVEAQMRRAWGLYGGNKPRQDQERGEQPVRMMDRFGPQGGNQGFHRRRFVQDGEIPVQVVRRDPTADSSAPQSSRLQRTEAALAAETHARHNAERALHDAQAQIAALQTKIGHAELSRSEAVDIARREREAAAQIRESSEGFEEQLQSMRDQLGVADEAREALQHQLSDERATRRTTERALRDAIARAASVEATLLLQEQEQDGDVATDLPPPLPDVPRRPVAVAPATPARRGRPPGSKAVAKPAVVESEPVKWWLMPTSKAKARV